MERGIFDDNPLPMGRLAAEQEVGNLLVVFRGQLQSQPADKYHQVDDHRNDQSGILKVFRDFRNLDGFLARPF